MEFLFRDLKANEIDVRIGTISDKGCSLLLYKDARVDMDILDETVGPMNWRRHHARDNANCIVSLWDDKKEDWISKEDVGVESYTQKEKGLASDSFKRACVNWGIGRELYTAPFIWVKADDVNIVMRDGKKGTNDRFFVADITVTNKEIHSLSIKNQSGKIVFTYRRK